MMDLGRKRKVTLGIAVVALLLILAPLFPGHEHPYRGIAAGKHCQGCLSVASTVSIVSTVPALTEPAASPFRLLPVEETVTYSGSAESRNRAPPLA